MAAKKKRPNDWSPPHNMRPLEASWYTGISESKLAKLRMQGQRENGPTYVKVVGCVIYPKYGLDDWLQKHVVQRATSDKHARSHKPRRIDSDRAKRENRKNSPSRTLPCKPALPGFSSEKIE